MEDYVEHVGDESVLVRAASPAPVKTVRDLGGVERAGVEHGWRISFSRRKDLAEIVQALQELGLAFAGGSSGWPAAAIVRQLRDEGLVHGTIREMLWSGPNQAVVRET